MEEMTISALVPWYGSKRTLAPRIIAQLGKHRAYVEAFAGSMAVLLAKPQCAVEVVNDLNVEVVNVARVLRDPATASQFHRRVRRWSLYTGVIDDAKAALTNASTPVDRAVAYFAMSWLGLNGYSGTDKELCRVNTAVRFTLLGGGDPVTRFRSARSSAWAFAKRLRHVDIRNGCAFELLERLADEDGQAIYCDPPYITKGAKYRHDFKPEDHQRLADILCRFNRARVVVSYYDHPDLASLYPGWTKVDCSLTKSLVSQGRRDSTHSAKAPEVLLANGPDYEMEKSQGDLFAA